MISGKLHTIASDTDADNQSCDDRTDPMKERVSGKNFFQYMKRDSMRTNAEKICVKRIAQGTHAVDAKRGQADGPALTYLRESQVVRLHSSASL